MGLLSNFFGSHQKRSDFELWLRKVNLEHNFSRAAAHPNDPSIVASCLAVLAMVFGKEFSETFEDLYSETHGPKLNGNIFENIVFETTAYSFFQLLERRVGGTDAAKQEYYGIVTVGMRAAGEFMSNEIKDSNYGFDMMYNRYEIYRQSRAEAEIYFPNIIKAALSVSAPSVIPEPPPFLLAPIQIEMSATMTSKIFHDRLLPAIIESAESLCGMYTSSPNKIKLE